MAGKPRTVGEYLKELRKNRQGKPPQIREALGIYVEMWERLIERGVISEADPLEEALSKIDSAGGLHQASS